MSTRVSAYGRENDGRGQPSLLTQLSVLLFSFFFGKKGGEEGTAGPHLTTTTTVLPLPSLPSPEQV